MIILLFFFTVSPLHGESRGEPLNELYEDGKYFAVIEQAEEILKDTSLSLQDKVGVHTILAFSYVVLGKDKLAKLEFLEALALNPELELDPILVSPKIMETFRETKRMFRLFPKQKIARPAPPKNLQSLAIPGIWEIKSGNKRRGYFLLGGSALSVVSLGFSHYQCEKYRAAYLDAHDPAVIEDKYSKYSFWYQSRTYFLASTILIYTFHLFLLAR
ncbi:MAG: hypothetical protein QMD71_07930 [bacterium]|nr:hypothetical protein [bacterium]